MKDSRSVAVEAILDTDKGIPIQEALHKRLSDLAINDRHLCSDLAYGTLRNRIRIRHILASVLKNPKGLPPAMCAALEVAVYSLEFQTKIPAWAILNETVKLIKNQSGQKLANVANASLRAIIRLQDQPAAVDWYGNGLAGKAAFYSLPQEIARLWQKAYPDYENLMARSSERPYTGLRLNTLHPDAERLAEYIATLPEAEKITQSGFAFPPGKTPSLFCERSPDYWHRQGAFSWQAAGSQLVLANLGIMKDWQSAPVWDACAGAGGKTHALLEAGVNVALSTDTSMARLRVLARENKRLGLAKPVILQADATKPVVQNWPGHIIADVPCSGLGVLARRPDLKARWNKKDTENLVNLQTSILASLYATLEPGGEICYITCTLHPAENEEQIQKFMRNHAGARLLREWQTPSDHPWLEGMYGARLIKEA